MIQTGHQLSKMKCKLKKNQCRVSILQGKNPANWIVSKIWIINFCNQTQKIWEEQKYRRPKISQLENSSKNLLAKNIFLPLHLIISMDRYSIFLINSQVKVNSMIKRSTHSNQNSWTPTIRKNIKIKLAIWDSSIHQSNAMKIVTSDSWRTLQNNLNPQIQSSYRRLQSTRKYKILKNN